jgi:hypothetical protein
VAEKLAKMYLAELADRGAIRKITAPSLDLRYELEPTVFNLSPERGPRTGLV